ncbi:MAG: hypothetical protein ACAI38_13020 [Myxococcota bacterium]|nr:hypothetical protein [Myxococcota bacterium]
MSATATVTQPASALTSLETVPVTAQPLAVVPEQPAAPKESRLDKAWQGFLASPHGRAMRMWGNGIGAAAGVGLPLVLTATAGYYVGDHNLWGASQWFGLGLGAIAGGIAIPAQVADNDALIPTFERAKNAHPKLASFLNVMAYMTVPATIAGLTASHYTNGAWGVTAAVIVGAIGAALGATAHNERLKDHPV